MRRELAYLILGDLAAEANRRFKQNLRNMNYGSGAQGVIYHALKWTLHPTKFDIDFRLDTGDPEMDKVINGLEFGTGIYGPKGEPIKAKYKKFLRFKKGSKTRSSRSGPRLPDDQIAFEKDGYIYTKYSRGVKPGFMMTKAVASIRRDWSMLVNQAELKYGIEDEL